MHYRWTEDGPDGRREGARLHAHVPGVGLAAITVFGVQGAIAAGAFLLRGVLDPPTILAITSAGGVVLLGVALRLLDL